MGYKLAVSTLSSSGSNTLNMGTPSIPTSATLIVQNKTGTAETVKHISIGTADGSGQRVTSYFKDGTTPTTFDSTSKCIAHYERVGGVITEILSATFTTFTSSGLTLNVTTPNANYNVYIRVDY